MYPLQLVTLKTELTVYVPDPALIQSTYQKLAAENTAAIFPYWAKIWASAHAMTRFLQEEPACGQWSSAAISALKVVKRQLLGGCVDVVMVECHFMQNVVQFMIASNIY